MIKVVRNFIDKDSSIKHLKLEMVEFDPEREKDLIDKGYAVEFNGFENKMLTPKLEYKSLDSLKVSELKDAYPAIEYKPFAGDNKEIFINRIIEQSK